MSGSIGKKKKGRRIAKRYWRIRGYEGLDAFFDFSVAAGSMTEGQVQELLKCLVAKAGLSYDEIVGAYVKRKTKRANNTLEVQKNGLYPEYSCGSNPHFSAIIVYENGKRVEYPE